MDTTSESATPEDAGQRTVPWLVFDGNCGFCTTSVTWLAAQLTRRDGQDPLLTPWQSTDLEAIGTTAERAQHEVLWITPSDPLLGGARAFAGWLQYRGGAYGLLGRAIDLPGVRLVAAGAYRVIARNRHRLPGGTPACALPTQNRLD